MPTLMLRGLTLAPDLLVEVEQLTAQSSNGSHGEGRSHIGAISGN